MLNSSTNVCRRHLCCSQPSFASVPADKLSTTMKTLAVPDNGNLVVTGALPVITGAVDADTQPQGSTTGHPDPSKSWFNRLYLKVRMDWHCFRKGGGHTLVAL